MKIEGFSTTLVGCLPVAERLSAFAGVDPCTGSSVDLTSCLGALAWLAWKLDRNWRICCCIGPRAAREILSGGATADEMWLLYESKPQTLLLQQQKLQEGLQFKLPRKSEIIEYYGPDLKKWRGMRGLGGRAWWENEMISYAGTGRLAVPQWLKITILWISNTFVAFK